MTNKAKQNKAKEVKAEEVNVVNEVITIETLLDKLQKQELSKFEFLLEVKKSEFDKSAIEVKQKVFEILMAFNSENLQVIEESTERKKDLQSEVKLLTATIKNKKADSKMFADKFGKLERLTKSDFVIWSYLNWNNPAKVISKAVEIWDFCAKSTLTTINAFGGSKDTNKKFIELAKDYKMQTAQTKQGLKVYKIEVDKLDDVKQKQVLKLQNVTLADFENEANIQRLRVNKIEVETSKENEIDESLQIVEVDF